ncbi:hypothetical protein G3I19_29180 [Streptomyces sp. SID10853]|uniref:hypothetical protein n=1 Tax=Streptomyces sp. SID10853 TaxID=2706028 RepID=UPI0013C298AE|nr:hypothetical protein [Streptomyces sp. SID10853]NDZ82537.1 hypothetical protein [Streptomyces sp. SID10853]
MSIATATCSRTEIGDLWANGGQFELRTVPLDPEVIVNLAEVQVPIPQSVLIGWVDVPAGDPRGATQHALYLTAGGYAYRVTTYLDGRRVNGESPN